MPKDSGSGNLLVKLYFVSSRFNAPKIYMIWMSLQRSIRHKVNLAGSKLWNGDVRIGKKLNGTISLTSSMRITCRANRVEELKHKIVTKMRQKIKLTLRVKMERGKSRVRSQMTARSMFILMKLN